MVDFAYREYISKPFLMEEYMILVIFVISVLWIALIIYIAGLKPSCAA